MLEWIVLSYFIEVGFQPTYNEKMIMDYEYSYDMANFRVSDTFYTDLGFELEAFKFLFIGGSVETQMMYTNPYFAPFLANYTFNAGIRLGENIEIGYEHLCTHPILISNNNTFEYKKFGGYDRVYFRISN